jgi:hypothetical protein
MLSEGFETAIPAMKMLQILGLDLMTTEIGNKRKTITVTNSRVR